MGNQYEEKNYLTDLTKIKETIRLNQNKAMVVVNSMMILTYYEIGTIINERKSWGNKYIQRLSLVGLQQQASFVRFGFGSHFLPF